MSYIFLNWLCHHNNSRFLFLFLSIKHLQDSIIGINKVERVTVYESRYAQMDLLGLKWMIVYSLYLLDASIMSSYIVLFVNGNLSY